MNRRNFLKRMAAVAAGAVVMPTLSRNRPGLDKFKLTPAQQLIIGSKDRYIFIQHIMGVDIAKGDSQHSERAWVQYKGIWDKIPYHQVGKRYYTGDGRIYLYMKGSMLC